MQLCPCLAKNEFRLTNNERTLSITGQSRQIYLLAVHFIHLIFQVPSISPDCTSLRQCNRIGIRVCVSVCLCICVWLSVYSCTVYVHVCACIFIRVFCMQSGRMRLSERSRHLAAIKAIAQLKFKAARRRLEALADKSRSHGLLLFSKRLEWSEDNWRNRMTSLL